MNAPQRGRADDPHARTTDTPARARPQGKAILAVLIFALLGPVLVMSLALRASTPGGGHERELADGVVEDLRRSPALAGVVVHDARVQPDVTRISQVEASVVNGASGSDVEAALEDADQRLEQRSPGDTVVVFLYDADDPDAQPLIRHLGEDY